MTILGKCHFGDFYLVPPKAQELAEDTADSPRHKYVTTAWLPPALARSTYAPLGALLPPPSPVPRFLLEEETATHFCPGVPLPTATSTAAPLPLVLVVQC